MVEVVVLETGRDHEPGREGILAEVGGEVLGADRDDLDLHDRRIVERLQERDAHRGESAARIVVVVDDDEGRRNVSRAGKDQPEERDQDDREDEREEERHRVPKVRPSDDSEIGGDVAHPHGAPSVLSAPSSICPTKRTKTSSSVSCVVVNEVQGSPLASMAVRILRASPLSLRVTDTFPSSSTADA